MTREHRIDFVCSNSLGTVLFTSPDEDLARRWALANTARFPSIRVERVTTTTERECVYRPRQAKRAAA